METNNKRPAEEIEAPAAKRQHTNAISREPSIFGIKAVDDVTKYIADFIAEHCQLENVEVSKEVIELTIIINLAANR
jgi:hypothetical protein